MTKYMWYQHLGTNLASNLVADKGKDLTFIYFSLVGFSSYELKRASERGFLLKTRVLLTNDLNIANDVIVVLPDVSN